ncbi:MAG: porin family protein, partial [Pseudolabrys sp.]|nr:porin family protein [Pseudolabrys sp.]
TRGGWTIGVGAAYAFTHNLSVFAEYDYYGFGTRSNTFIFNGTPAVVFDVANVRQNTSVAKVGLNWKVW